MSNKTTLIYAASYQLYEDFIKITHLDPDKCIFVTSQRTLDGWNRQNSRVIFVTGWDENLPPEVANMIRARVAWVWEEVSDLAQELAGISGLVIGAES